MLQSYANQTDVPEALREHYSKRQDGKWHADIADDHPTVTHNAKLVSEKSQVEGKLKEAQDNLEKANVLPRGHVAIAKADAEALEKLKTLGTVDEVTAKVNEHQTLKEAEAKRVREDAQASAAKELGYNLDAFKLLKDLPDFEVREKDGKKSVIAKVKEGETLVEKDGKTFMESNYAASMPSLQAKPGVTVPANGSGTDSQPASQFQSAREYGKQYNETRATGASELESRFGLAKSA